MFPVLWVNGARVLWQAAVGTCQWGPEPYLWVLGSLLEAELWRDGVLLLTWLAMHPAYQHRGNCTAYLRGGTGHAASSVKSAMMQY